MNNKKKKADSCQLVANFVINRAQYLVTSLLETDILMLSQAATKSPLVMLC